MTGVADIAWFKRQFGREIEGALTETPFDLEMIVAIACQETGQIWSILRKKSLSRTEIVALCVGDTLDDTRGRSAFPKNKAELVGKPNGQRMFDIARQALVDMAKHVPGYQVAVSNPNKFCHGFGVFQRDLQFYLSDPDYFLEKRYEKFENTLDHCLFELRRCVKKLRFDEREKLNDFEFACVAIAYNTGGFKREKGLKQGYFDGLRFYGENIAEYVKLARTVDGTGDSGVSGSHVVAARGGLHLRKGPGLAFGVTRTLAEGSIVNVLGFDGPGREWARVDLEGDGLADGHLHASFLRRVDPVQSAEAVPEPEHNEEVA